MAKRPEVAIEELYKLRPKAFWSQFRKEHFSFWMICGYLFIEYVRPQSIIPALDFLPWAKVFILLALASVFVDPKRKWVSLPANKWMIAFFIVILLSSWQAFRPDISFKFLDSFYTWLIIYFLIINIVNTRERFFIFLAIFVVASFKISYSLALTWAKRGFGFTSWGLMGPPGFFQNSGELAIQMAVFLPIAYVIAVQLKPYLAKWKFYFLALMPITAAMTILGSSSRGGQLALAVQLLLMFYKQIFRPKALVVCVLVGSLLYVVLPEEQKQRFSDSGNDKTSQQRLNYWKGGVEMMNEHPGLGVGYFNFSPYFTNHFPHLLIDKPAAELPHNIFVQAGADLGWTGLFVYLMLIKSGFVLTRKGQRGGGVFDSLSWAFNISFLGFLISGQFVSVAYYPFMWIHLAMVGSLRNVVAHQSLPKNNSGHITSVAVRS